MKIDLPRIINDLDYAALGLEKTATQAARKMAKRLVRWSYLRCRLAEAQNWRCAYCGEKMTEELGQRRTVTADHIIPRSKGGKDDAKNLVAACYRCNTNRGSTDAYVYFEARQNNVNFNELDKLKRLRAKVLQKSLDTFDETGKSVIDRIPLNVFQWIRTHRYLPLNVQDEIHAQWKKEKGAK